MLIKRCPGLQSWHCAVSTNACYIIKQLHIVCDASKSLQKFLRASTFLFEVVAVFDYEDYEIFLSVSYSGNSVYVKKHWFLNL